MAINAQTVTETYVKRLTEVNSRSVVECRIQGEDITEILAVSPQVALTSCEVSSGRINYGGRLICTAVYTGANGLTRVQKGAEFTHYADGEGFAPAQTAVCSLSCEKVTVRRDGSAYVIAAVISAEIAVYGNAERAYLTGADGAVCRSGDVTFINSVTFSGEGEVEDDFEAAAVSDILMHEARAVVTDCKCGAGEIQVSGEIYLSMLALRSGEPASLDRVIPFSCEIACDEAAYTHKADCIAHITEAAVAAQVDEERARCNLRFTATLSFAGVFCELREAQAVTDAFLTDGGCNLAFYTENTPLRTETRVYSERVTGVCASSSQIDFSCALKAVTCPRAECTYNPADGSLQGAVSCILIYLKENELHASQLTLPFSLTLNGLTGQARIQAAVCGVSVRQRTEGECEGEATLKIAASAYQSKDVECVAEIERTDEKPADYPAVSVLFAGGGETLWDVSKKLLRSPEDVSAACSALTFPLKGGERVVVYRAKTDTD